MHISGKILAGFVVLLGLGAVYLSARTMGIRQGWMEQAQKNQEEFQKKQQQLVDARADRDKKRAEFVRANVGWERTYEGPNVQVGVDENGTILVDGVGTTNGVKPGDVVYVFVLGQEGASNFLGAVQVADAGEARLSGRPYVRIRPGEIGPTNQKFLARVRKLVPTRFQNELASIDQRLLLLEQSLANAADDQRFLKDLQDRTDLLIADRVKELNGDPSLESANIPEVNKTGLLASIATEEEVRNAALLEGDQLLRRLLRTRQKLNEVLTNNRELARSLPQPPAKQAALGQARR